tara:strand:- start:284 stop:505 length:222 start_codon:yes stop_codon:yes gene_type:complete
MLLVPWVYQRCETERVPAARFADWARQIEIELIGMLIANARQQDGSDHSIIGSESRANLRHLPSSAYFAELGR